MKTITCYCEQKFDVPYQESINIDETPQIMEDIEKGKFQTYTCPSCGNILKVEFRTRLFSLSRNISLFYLPEVERFTFFSGTIPIAHQDSVIIGYPELIDRMRILNTTLDIQTVEAIKYHLLEKAYENAPESSLSVLFRELNKEKSLIFYLYGMKKDEIAIMTVPFSLYEKIQKQIRASPDEEPYAALINGPYISVQNISFEAEVNEE